MTSRGINKDYKSRSNDNEYYFSKRQVRKGCYVFLTLVIVLTSTTASVAFAESESYSFVASWGPSGSAPGNFTLPKAAAVDGSTGNVFVVDTGNHRIQKFSADGSFITQWPSEPVPQGTAFYNNPLGIAIDEDARIVYVTNAIIQKYDADNGTFLGQFGESGLGIGQLYGPEDIAIDSEGFVYVIDASNNRVNKFSSDGDFITSWGSWCNINGGNPFASPGTDTSCVDPDGSDGPLKPGDGQFNYPNGIAIDLSSGYIYVADSGNNRLQKFTADGRFLESWPGTGTAGSELGQLNFPASIEVDSFGNLYVADNGNYRILKSSSNGTILASWGSFGSGEGQFKRQVTASVNPGNEVVYTVDMENDRVQVFSPQVTDVPAVDYNSGSTASNEGNGDTATSGTTTNNNSSDSSGSGDDAAVANDTSSTTNTEPAPTSNNELPSWGNQTPPAGKAWVMVWTRDGSTDNRIDGYYAGVTRQSDDFTITSYSPTSFELDAGAKYSLWVADYGNYVFDHWQDTGSNNRQRTLSMGDMATLELTAIYRDVNTDNGSSPPPPPPANDGGSNLLIRSTDSNGKEIYGYYAILYQNGSVESTDFTPASFDTASGERYTVEVQDYGGYYFDHWLDNDSTDRDRAFAASDSTVELTAVYRTGADSQSPPPPPPSTESNSVTFNIKTVDSNGDEIYGYYTTLWHGTQLVKEGFSPVSFTVEAGQSYGVTVADYGSYHFDHWSDGNDSNFMSFRPEAGQTISLTAVYRTD